MTPQAKRQKEDWKLLLIIGGALVAVVVTIATLARLGSDWETKEAQRATAPSPPVVEEYAAVASLKLPPAEYVEPMIAAFERRRNVVYDAVSAMPGVLAYKPAGAFYMAPEFPVDDAEKFVEWMLTDFDLDGETTMLAPANGFYSTPGRGVREARIAYVLNEEELVRAMACLAAGLEAYPGRTS